MTTTLVQKLVGNFPTGAEQETLEFLLGGQERFDRLEAGFDAFLRREDKWQSFLDSPDDLAAKNFLHLVKLYLRHYRAEREAIFAGTALQASHCLSKGLLASGLCWRKGIVATVARPYSHLRYYHAVVAYQTNTKFGETYQINGSSSHNNYIILSQDDILARLRLMQLAPVFVKKFLRRNT